MEELYDNLDNYNESKLIEELRTENLDLKGKIEKYTVTLENLQKDFDKVAAEYKKLEFNYSSLLKTARAEVERKTQIITNLNIEKDMMVLNAIQNGNIPNLRRNWARTKPNNNRTNEGAALNKNAANQPKPESSKTGRNEGPKTPTEDRLNPVSAGNTIRDNVKNEKCVERTSDTKENIHEVQKDKPGRPAGIRDRRKSMPATSFSVAKFSSDEEGEVTSPVIEEKKDYLYNESGNCRNSDRNLCKDIHPFDDRNRYYDSETYRNRDRFEPQRHRLSPDRFFQRSKRDYSGDRRFRRGRSKDHRQYRDGSGGYRSDKGGERFYRDGPGDNRYYKDRLGDCKPYRDNSGDRRPYRDNSGDRRPYRDNSGDIRPQRDNSGDPRSQRDGSGDPRYHRDGSGENRPRREEPDHKKPELRKRRLESPTADNFQQYQQKNHEEFEREYNDERNKVLEDAGIPSYHSDYEAPSNKRIRTESHHRSDQDSKSIRGKAKDFLDKAPQSAVGNIQSEDMSCQSPDYLSTELASLPKEIKLDSEIKMDDPREHSNKYTVRTENGERVLTTVGGRNVDLKPVNKSVWDLEKVKKPLALVRRPSDDHISDLYGDMDIDNPTSDVSVESGATMGCMYDISTDPFHFDRHKNDVDQNKKNEDKKCYEKNIAHSEKDKAQVLKVNENSKCIEKVRDQIENVIDMPGLASTSTEKNVEQEMMQTESIEEYTSKIDETVVPAKDVATYSQNDGALPVQSKIVDPQSSEQDAIQAESAVPSNAEKDIFPLEKTIRETADIKEHSNVSKSKYKIPKLRNKDQSGNHVRRLSNDKYAEDGLEVDKHSNRNRKLLDNKHFEDRSEVREGQMLDNKRTEDKLEVRERKLSDKKYTGDKIEFDKHDDVSPKYEYPNKNTVVNATERRICHTTTAADKGMVEGDLELSDESSDVDLLKRVMKKVEKQLPCQSKRVSDMDDKHEAEDCTKNKSISNNSENDVDLKLKVEENTKSEASDTGKKGKSKSKSNKQKSEKETLKIVENVALSTHLKLQETEAPKDIKSKFSDLFGDSSSLITPEDLGLTAQDVRIESTLTNYFPIFEDAQDAADVGGKVGQTKMNVMTSLEESHIGANKLVINIDQNKGIDQIMDKNENVTNPSESKEKEIHNNKPTDEDITKNKPQQSKSLEKEQDITKHKPQLSKSLEKEQHDLKPIDTNTKTKFCKNTEFEHVIKKVEASEKTKNNSKNLEKQHVSNIDTDSTKPKSKPNRNVQVDANPLHIDDSANELESKTYHEIKTKDTKNSEISKTKQSKNEINKAKTIDTCSKYLQREKCDNPLDQNQTKSRPSKDTVKVEANDTKRKLSEIQSKTKHSKNEIVETNTRDNVSKYTETEKYDKPLGTNQTKLKLSKDTGKIETNDTKIKTLEIQSKAKHSKINDTNQTKSKPSKDTGNVDSNDIKTKTIETRKRKSKRHEDKSLAIETGETPQPAVITVETDKTSAQLTFNKSYTITKEPEIVKTVIISSGVQPLAVQENMPVNVISPILEEPVTPNIDSRQTIIGNPMLGHPIHIHALATSTPAKEIVQNVPDVSCGTDVSNTSNEQHSVGNNDTDAPDVRIFVKRRRRVVKKATPSNT